MPKISAKKQTVICNISVPVTDSKKDKKQAFLIYDWKIVKFITWNIKLNQGNKEILTLIDLSTKANLISRSYTAPLPLKIFDSSCSLAIIKKQQLRTEDIVFASFIITDNANHICLFKEIFFIADIPELGVLNISFLKLGYQKVC